VNRCHRRVVVLDRLLHLASLFCPSLVKLEDCRTLTLGSISILRDVGVGRLLLVRVAALPIQLTNIVRLAAHKCY
jgi:hypothetical protein